MRNKATCLKIPQPYSQHRGHYFLEQKRATFLPAPTVASATVHFPLTLGFPYSLFVHYTILGPSNLSIDKIRNVERIGS
jgi:hypothetical protein